MNEIQRAGEQVKSVLLKQRNLIYAICIGKSRKGTSAKYQFLYPKGQVLIDLTKPLAILTGHTYEDGLAVIKSGDPQHLLNIASYRISSGLNYTLIAATPVPYSEFVNNVTETSEPSSIGSG